jgi:hypothetical protein
MSTVQASGLTVEEALLWADAYAWEAKRNPKNFSAAPRAQLLRCVAKMLERHDPDAIGAACCLEEMAWRRAAPPSGEIGLQ